MSPRRAHLGGEVGHGQQPGLDGQRSDGAAPLARHAVKPRRRRLHQHLAHHLPPRTHAHTPATSTPAMSNHTGSVGAE